MGLKQIKSNGSVRRGQAFFLTAILVFMAVCARAEELDLPVRQVSGVVKSVSSNQIRVSRRFSQSYYLSYVFYINDKTRIIGAVQKGAFVEVKFSKLYEKPGFVSVAEEIRVLQPPNSYYLRMY